MATVRRVRRSLVSAGFALVLGTQALATTYVVDDNGGLGVDFTDLPAAVAAAQPGDVLRVMAGSYSAFSCSKGITILGYGGPTVGGTVVLASIPVGRPFVMVGISPQRFIVTACDATVILQHVPSVEAILIETSMDVRLLDVHPDGGHSQGQTGIDVLASRVEIVQSTAVGGGYSDHDCFVEGGSGVRAASSSRVHLALTDSTGGSGPYCLDNGSLPAPGGPGILVAGSELILAGGGQASIRGGAGGLAWWYQRNCYYDSVGGNGIYALNADVAYSRAGVSGGPYGYSPGHFSECFDAEAPAFGGSTITFVAPRHSTLALTGTPVAGQAVLLTLDGVPGSRASMWIGRQWTLVSDAGVDIELAVDRLKVIELGLMPSSGSIAFPLEISGAYPPGTLLGVQGECRFESGLVRRTNSIPIVVR